jgi:transposase-like protein
MLVQAGFNMPKISSIKYIDNTLQISLTSKYIFDTISTMRYTKRMFDADYPNDDACLDTVFKYRFGDLKICPKCGVSNTKFYRVKKRQCYACMHCGYQLHPLADTVFRKTTTPLKDWFYAIYLFSVSKNGVSAKELERHLGVTYKTAWRMAREIRKLMDDSDFTMSGTVEADEAYYGKATKRGGKQYNNKWHSNKSAIMGIVERNGKAKAIVTSHATFSTAFGIMRLLVEPGTQIYTDEAWMYRGLKRHYPHESVNHSKEEYVRGAVHTNTIEGFWGQLKRSISGTYHVVSPKYLQLYVNEFCFRYNYRDYAVCPALVERASKLSRLDV